MRINAIGIAQRYELEGPANAPVVAMSHSLAANLSLWDAQAAALVPRYRVLRYDIRGHGGSDVPPAPYTLKQMAADLHGLMQALGIADAHMVCGFDYPQKPRSRGQRPRPLPARLPRGAAVHGGARRRRFGLV